MLRVPLAPTQTSANDLQCYQQALFVNQRPNEMIGASDNGISGNGFIGKMPLVRDPMPSLSSLPPGIGSGHMLLQSRSSEPTLAASIAEVPQTSSHNQPGLSLPNHPHSTASTHQMNGRGLEHDMSHLNITHNECRAKYDRLLDAHRKLQRTNGALEDKLLRIVEKFEGEKNLMRMDLASQTQKLVESKLTIQQLRDQNEDLQSDLHLSINLLRNRPTSFMSQRLDTLPPDIQQRVRGCLAENARDRQLQRLSRGPSEGRKIRIAIPPDGSIPGGTSVSNGASDSDKISAAILAKVLEERDKERQGDMQLRIDVGTQTHGWNHFPGTEKIHASQSNSSTSSSTTGGINKDIYDGANTNKCEGSNISSSNSSSADQSPVTNLELNDGTICDQIKEEKDPAVTNVPTSTAVVINPEKRLQSTNDVNLPEAASNLTATFISNSCKSLSSDDHCFITESSQPNTITNATTSSVAYASSISNNTSIASNNLLRSTIASTTAYPNVTSVVTSQLNASSFSASAASSHLTRSATFSAMQTDI